MRPLNYFRHFSAPLSLRRWVTALPWLISCALAAGTDSATNHTPAHPPTHTGGINYIHDEVADVPWSIHIVKVDRSHADLRFETTLGAGTQLGMSVVSEQVKALPAEFGRPLAALNGDFFKSHDKYPGDPEGLQIMRGELISAPRPTHSCFWIDAAGQPRVTNIQGRFTATLRNGTVVPFGLNEERTPDDAVLYTAANGTSTRTSGGVELVLTRGTATNWLPLQVGETYTATVSEVHADGDARLTADTMILSAGPKAAARLAKVKPGEIVKISTATVPDVRGSLTAIGGGPALVRGGKALPFTGLQPRHPRSAFGWNKDYFFLVEVDGRQRTSAGMSFPELATYLANLGCTDAINLDGGGSATLWAYGNVMNSPSEGHERPAANALVVVRKETGD